MGFNVTSSVCQRQPRNPQTNSPSNRWPSTDISSDMVCINRQITYHGEENEQTMMRIAVVPWEISPRSERRWSFKFRFRDKLFGSWTFGASGQAGKCTLSRDAAVFH